MYYLSHSKEKFIFVFFVIFFHLVFYVSKSYFETEIIYNKEIV
jgi:hypothetical protein